MIDRVLDRLPSWARGPAEVLVGAVEEYGRDRVGRMAAALAYRTVFALAPLLIIAVSLVGLVLGGSGPAREQMLQSVESVAGARIAETLETYLASALRNADTAAVVGFALLVWIGSSLLLELQQSLNDIFEVPFEKISGWGAMIRKRVIGFLWAFGLGLMLLVVLLLNAIWRFIGNLLPEDMDTLHQVVGYLSPLVSLLLLPLLFILTFQTLTAVRVPWKAVWWGGMFTSVVFVAAAYGVGIYFDVSSGPTALGFAGSFVIIVFLAYLLSTVFLFGAEVTKVYADRLGERSPKPEGAPL